MEAEFSLCSYIAGVGTFYFALLIIDKIRDIIS